MPRRHLAIIGTVLVAGVASLVTIASVNIHRQHAAAERELSGATAFLRSSPAYKDVQVEVSEHQGGGLWFTGSMPTQAECDRLEAELGERYNGKAFVFMFSVLSRS